MRRSSCVCDLETPLLCLLVVVTLLRFLAIFHLLLLLLLLVLGGGGSRRMLGAATVRGRRGRGRAGVLLCLLLGLDTFLVAFYIDCTFRDGFVLVRAFQFHIPFDTLDS